MPEEIGPKTVTAIQGQDTVELDKAAITGVWVSKERVLGLDGQRVHFNPNLYSNLQTLTVLLMIQNQLKSKDSTHFGPGPFNVVNTVDRRWGGRVLFEFKMQPKNATVIAKFDVTRSAKAISGFLVSGGDNVTLEERKPGAPDRSKWPEYVEAANDDTSNTDEQVDDPEDTRNGYLYSIDGPAYGRISEIESHAILQSSFNEWVRVRFDNDKFGSSEAPQGSRGSPVVPWGTIHYLYYQDPAYDCVSALDSDAVRVSASDIRSSKHIPVNVTGPAATNSFSQ